MKHVAEVFSGFSQQVQIWNAARDLYCCLLPQCVALRTCCSGFLIATLQVLPRASSHLCKSLSVWLHQQTPSANNLSNTWINSSHRLSRYFYICPNISLVSLFANLAHLSAWAVRQYFAYNSGSYRKTNHCVLYKKHGLHTLYHYASFLYQIKPMPIKRF